MIVWSKFPIAVLTAWLLSMTNLNACMDINESKFLAGMYSDSYFPKHLVNKTKDILLELCNQIEKTKPRTIEEVYLLTHTATLEINKLQSAFLRENSEIETAARESIAESFILILDKTDLDYEIEEAIAPREW